MRWASAGLNNLGAGGRAYEKANTRRRNEKNKMVSYGLFSGELLVEGVEAVKILVRHNK